jgi:hypothetical protein
VIAVARQLTLTDVNNYQLPISLPRRYGCEASLDQSPTKIKGIDESVATLEGYLNEGFSVHGMSSNRYIICDSRQFDGGVIWLEIICSEH